jgi:hypothetical protein
MAYYIYNGVPLPELPSEISEFPYAVIIRKTDGSYSLVLCKKAFVSEISGGYNAITNNGEHWLTYRSQKGGVVWEFVGEFTSGMLTIVMNPDINIFVWTSHDIDGTGSYLHYGYTTIDHPNPYLFNDVPLPPLPKWDKVKYPYAFIFVNAFQGISFEVVSALPFVRSETGYMYIPDHARVVFSCFDSQWEKTTEDDNRSGYDHLVPFWTNFDLLNENDTLYLAASDPIPVNPPDIIDPDISEEITFQSFEPSVTAIDFPSSDVTTIEFSLNPNIDFSKDTDFQDHQDLSLEFIEKNE